MKKDGFAPKVREKMGFRCKFKHFWCKAVNIIQVN